MGEGRSRAGLHKRGWAETGGDFEQNIRPHHILSPPPPPSSLLPDTRTNFLTREEVVFNSLYTLIDDARSLRDYAATALANVQVGVREAVCG